MEIGSGVWDRELGLVIEIGDKDQVLGSEIGIAIWDWGLELGIKDWVGRLRLGIGIGTRIGDWVLVVGDYIGDQDLGLGTRI